MSAVRRFAAEVALVGMVGSRGGFVNRSALQIQAAEEGLVRLLDFDVQTSKLPVQKKADHTGFGGHSAARRIHVIAEALPHEGGIAPARVQVQAMSSLKRFVVIEKNLERLLRPTSRPRAAKADFDPLIDLAVRDEGGGMCVL